MTSARTLSGGAARHDAAAGSERPLMQARHEIEVKPMRSSTRIGSGVLLAAIILGLAAQAARAQSPICPWPADVPGDLVTSIDTCFNCLRNNVVVPDRDSDPGSLPCPPPTHPPTEVWVKVPCYDFPEAPTTQICDGIASAETRGCTRAVADAARCNDAVNTANATAQTAVCSTFADPSEGAACASDVQADLAAQTANVRNAAAAGRQACQDLTGSVRSLCLGVPF